MAKLIDLTGTKIDKLTILEKAPSRHRHVYWKCQCDCGNECDIDSYLLRHSHTQSCGCISTSIGEKNIENILQENQILYEKRIQF